MWSTADRFLVVKPWAELTAIHASQFGQLRHRFSRVPIALPSDYSSIVHVAATGRFSAVSSLKDGFWTGVSYRPNLTIAVYGSCVLVPVGNSWTTENTTRPSTVKTEFSITRIPLPTNPMGSPLRLNPQLTRWSSGGVTQIRCPSFKPVDVLAQKKKSPSRSITHKRSSSSVRN
jgi:hypothetical protein